jgi:hypothetical protein
MKVWAATSLVLLGLAVLFIFFQRAPRFSQPGFAPPSFSEVEKAMHLVRSVTYCEMTLAQGKVNRMIRVSILQNGIGCAEEAEFSRHSSGSSGANPILFI